MQSKLTISGRQDYLVWNHGMSDILYW